MNRELKFKAWYEKMSMWVYININEGLTEMGLKVYREITLSGSQFFQYTGLTDKNGKEIYEGDVVDVAYAQRDDEGYVVSDPPARGFVDWNEHSTGWIVRTQSKMSVTPDGTVMTSIITKEPGYVEIIGHKIPNT